jgi:hypothetical protein
VGKTNLNLGWLGHVPGSVTHPDLPKLIRARSRAGLRADQAVFIVAPAMTTPAVTYLQKATRRFRASATSIVLRARRLPPVRA